MMLKRRRVEAYMGKLWVCNRQTDRLHLMETGRRLEWEKRLEMW